MDIKEREENGTADYYLDLKKYIKEFIDRNYPLTAEDFEAFLKGEQTDNIIKRQETERILNLAMKENLSNIANKNSQIIENAEQGKYTSYTTQDYNRDLNNIIQNMLKKLWEEQHPENQINIEDEEQTNEQQDNYPEEQNDLEEEQENEKSQQESENPQQENENLQQEQTDKQLIDEIAEAAQESEMRLGEINDANREIKETEKKFIKEQQDKGKDIGE